MTASNRRILLAERPGAAGVTAELFRLDSAARPEPGPGEALVRNIYLSLDPAMRGWISAVANYSEPVPIDGVMRAFAVGQVAASRHPTLKVGDYLYGRFGWQEWALTDGATVERVIEERDLPLTSALHLLGINGCTAWLGLANIGRPKAGETVVVSTAAGAVGSVVGQIAKLKGCRTVGITGGPEKVRTCLTEFRYDAAIDYRGEDVGAALDKAAPQGIDVYFDNVGGPISDAVMERINVGARIVLCGTMGIPSSPPPQGPRYNRALLVKRALMQGFIIFDHADQLAQARTEIAAWARAGLITTQLDIVQGLEATVPHLLRLLAGKNSGKAIVQVAPEAR